MLSRAVMQWRRWWWWWVVTAAASLSTSLALPDTSNFLQELRELGLAFEVLPPMRMSAATGSDVTIPCQPISTERGVANVTWLRDAKPLNDERRYVLQNGTLLIKKVKDSDYGMYSCVLSVGKYSVAAPFAYLKMPTMSAWQIQPLNNTVEVGRAVRLSCHISSSPVATYTWLKDNETLPDDDRYCKPYPGVLQIIKLKPEDNGVYSCKVVNQLLKKEKHSNGGYLKIVAPKNSSSESGGTFQHSLLATPSKVTAHLGERAVLECITDAEDPIILWSRIDGELIPENRTRIIGQGSLEFMTTLTEDRGVYNCSALNKNMEGRKTMMILFSIMTPPVLKLKMKVDNQGVSKPTVIKNGSTMRITCKTWGFPRPSISWFKNGLLHVNSERHLYTNKNETDSRYYSEDLYISIIMFRDMGLYQCVTRNEAGVASEGLILKIDQSNVPPPPTNLRALKTHAHNVDLAWDAPPGFPPPNAESFAYMVSVFIDKTSQEHLISNTSIHLKELKSNSNYTFYVRSVIIEEGAKSHLISEPSEFIHVMTRAESHPSDPAEMPKVFLTPKSLTELFANWTFSAYNRNIEIVQQKIQWMKKKQHYHETKVLPANVTSYVITGLIPGKTYSVRVLIATHAGYPEHMTQLPWYMIKMPRGDSGSLEDSAFLPIQLFTFSQKPSEILVTWTLAVSLVNDVSFYHVLYNNSESSWQKKLEPTNTSLVLTDLEPDSCYSVQVQAILHDGSKQATESIPLPRNTTESFLKTLCTLPLSPLTAPQHFTPKIKVKKLKAKALNSTSVLIIWKHKCRKLLVDFYTIKIENVQVEGQMDPEEEAARAAAAPDSPPKEEVPAGVQSSPEPPVYGEEPLVMDGQDIRFYRVTNRRLIVTDLKPLNNYSITVTASNTRLTGPAVTTYIIPDEGVPTPPLNVTWVAASPKDAILTWSPPRLANGRLLSYLIAFSHDEQEWRNQTIHPYHTTTQIEDLVSNTNYTVNIAGVTRKGPGASTTVFIYIRATLVGEPQITTESVVVISVVSLLAVVTCVVAVLLCFRILRLRNINHNSLSVYQGNGTCRMVYANGVKSSGRDHDKELDDYKPMLASLPPATQNHHLDTKGGPGSHDDGIVANSLLDPSAIQMNQGEGSSEGTEPLRDSLAHHHHGMLDGLDDIDDPDDVSRRLLQGMSAPQPVFSKSTKEFDHPRVTYNSTQVDNHLSTAAEDSGMKVAVSS